MVVVSKTENFKRRIASKKWLFFTTSLGMTFLLIPILILCLDPILIIVRYFLRLGNGSILHGLMEAKLDGPRIYVSLFNITNAEEFISGRDQKLKVDEIGPFVYQEYRLNKGLVIDPETEIMSYTPQIWAEFIREESVADPKDVYVTMPSVPMMTATDMMSKYPFFVRNIFSVLAASIHSKAIVKISAHDYLWGYSEPLIKLGNTAVPGLFYYNSSGIMERLYDIGVNYKIELGTKDEDKFNVKRVRKFREAKNISSDLIENVQTFTDAYEGAAFPPGMTPEMPLYIYRHSVCKVFRLQFTGVKKTEYGSDAFTYDLANDTLNDHQLCLGNGWCPGGLVNLAPCYYNFSFALSRGHFLDGDPRILDKLDGIKPDRKLHSTEMIIDPKLGVTLTSAVSVQLNLALGDIGYNIETRRFKNMVLPLCHAKLKHPKLPSLAIAAFHVMYTYGPYVTMTIIILCFLLGIGFLMYSTKMFYWNWVAGRNNIFKSKLEDNLKCAYLPLMINKELTISRTNCD